jgi:hypothetical protein
MHRTITLLLEYFYIVEKSTELLTWNLVNNHTFMFMLCFVHQWKTSIIITMHNVHNSPTILILKIRIYFNPLHLSDASLIVTKMELAPSIWFEMLKSI